MKALSAFLVLSLLLAVPGLPAPAPPQPPTYKKDPGPSVVTATLLDWHDKARDRRVPVKIYAPATGAGPFPVIVFSHGLGGSREGYEYLGRHWASWGHVAVHVEHLGSNAAAGAALLGAASDPRNAVARPRDVRFILDRLETLSRGGSPLSRRLDLSRVGMAGHSFGSWTTMTLAGQRVFPEDASLADPRIKAAVAMSTAVPSGMKPEDVYRHIHIPIFHLTGTLDDSPVGGTKAADRCIPYDHIHGVDQYLVTLQGGDHMVFEAERKSAFQSLILQGTTAFWDAYLKGDARAKAWLAGGGYAAELGKDGRLEAKR
jgi:predicted dienelactone hydrolase